jgi:hypothetical protein
MAAIIFKVNGLAKLEKRADKYRDSVQNGDAYTRAAANEIGLTYWQALDRRVPVDSGNLRSKLNVQLTGGSYHYLIKPEAPGVEYLKYILSGTKPHQILPKKGNYLVFNNYFGPGPIHHPGTKPNRFDEKAFKAVEVSITNRMKRLGKKLVPA